MDADEELTLIDSFAVPSNSTFDPDSPLATIETTIDTSAADLTITSTTGKAKKTKLKHDGDRKLIDSITDLTRITYTDVKNHPQFHRVNADKKTTEYVQCIKCGAQVKYISKQGNK